MGETAKVALTLIGGTLLLCNVAGLISDVPLWSLAVVDLIAGSLIGLVIIVWMRFTEQGQQEQLMDRGLDAGEQPGKRKLMSRAFIYAAVAIISLLIGLQGFLNPELGGGRYVGISGTLLAAALGFLAFREHRSTRTEPDLSPNSKPLASLNAAPARAIPPKPSPIGSPTTTLIVMVVFVILLVITDVRMIPIPSGPNGTWIGVGQMVIWVPIFGYLAYREFRRMHGKPKQPGGIEERAVQKDHEV